jgi:hypothetical protein
MMIGLVLFVSGLSLVIFFNEENLIIAPGTVLGIRLTWEFSLIREDFNDILIVVGFYLWVLTHSACGAICCSQVHCKLCSGATLGVLGGLLVLAGICSWSSECLCADLARSLIDRFEEAPAKNAQKRRRRRAIK